MNLPMRTALLLALAATAFACRKTSSPQQVNGGSQALPDAGPQQVDGGSQALPDAGPAPSDAGTACRLSNGITEGILVQAYVDADKDGHAGTAVDVCVLPGSALPAGYFAAPDDCDDGNPAVWSPQPFFPDVDHDGVGVEPAKLLCAADPPAGFAASAGDCAPNDRMRWQLLSYAFRDQDADGYTVPSAGTVCTGAALPSGYTHEENGSDCDDTKFFVWQVLSYAYRDHDGDGFYAPSSGSLCTDASLPPGYLASYSGIIDCYEDDRYRAEGPPAYLDQDGDGVGDGPAVLHYCTPLPPSGYASTTGDCAPEDATRWRMLPYTYRDADGDGWTMAASGAVCAGAALPVGYLTAAGKGNDCDDTNASLFQSLTGYADNDGDRVGAGAAQALCTGGTLPEGYVSDGTDCDDEDGTTWRTVRYIFADRDGDGYTVPEPGPLCVGAALPSPYVATANGNDCDDRDGKVWRKVANFFADRDGDGYTVAETGSLCVGAILPSPYVATANGNDCDDGDGKVWRWVVLYPDRDGDGVGAPPRDIQCLGAAIPTGYSTEGWDSDDGDPTVQWDPADLDVVLGL